MLHKLYPLSALRLFEAAGRRGGFTAAAEELGVTPSAVSHAIRSLEDRLGIPLFHRAPGGLRLTAAGVELLDETSRAMQSLSRVVERITRSRSSAGLTLSTGPTFASRWLVPRLAALRRRHPRISISISTERHWVDLADGDFDLAIRVAREPSGAGEWFHLAQERLVPVAAKALAGLPLADALRRVSVVSPGPTDTAMMAATTDEVREERWLGRSRSAAWRARRRLRRQRCFSSATR